MTTKTKKFFEKRVSQLRNRLKRKGMLSERDAGRLVFYERQLSQAQTVEMQRNSLDYASSKE